MKVIVCGGRHFDDYKYLSYALDTVLENNNDIEIVSGHCEGADKLGEKYAKENNLNLKIFPANWAKYGKAAGPIRNHQMVDYIKSFKDSLVVAFTNKNSVGTKDTINYAKKNGVNVEEFSYENEELQVSLYEGIRYNGNEFEYNFDSDEADDIIKLTSTHIHSTRFNHKIKYYGYKINNRDGNHKLFLNYIKSDNALENYNFIKMIDNCIEDLYSKTQENHFDCIIKVESSSRLNSIICNKIIDEYDDCDLVDADKIEVAYLDFDWERLRKTYNTNHSAEYYDGFERKLRGMINYFRKKGKFSISNFPGQYRKYLKSMFEINNNAKDLNTYKNILIVDDVFTSGSTFKMVINALNNTGYTGEISIFSLINNS